MNNKPADPPPGRAGNALLFARNFFRHPRMLGSIVPSSRFLIKQLLEPINFGRARVIVEYGPGVGVITAELLRRMFGPNTVTRFRPSYFPFTEPSAEFDFSCFKCKGTGCRICKNSGWIELGGSGMVHPNVLRTVGVDPQQYSGFAFGFGIDRMCALMYELDDIRLLFENDVRFLGQFE